jgi:hypothetical protein
VALEKHHYTAVKYSSITSGLKGFVNPNVTDKATPALSEVWSQAFSMARAIYDTLKHSGGMRYLDTVDTPCCLYPAKSLEFLCHQGHRGPDERCCPQHYQEPAGAAGHHCHPHHNAGT